MELKTFLLSWKTEKTKIVWTCEKGQRGVLGEIGEVRVLGATASRKA